MVQLFIDAVILAASFEVASPGRVLFSTGFRGGLDAPYFTKGEWVSSFHFGPYIQAEVTPPTRALVHDVTLGDGEEAPRIAFTPEEKTLIALELDKLGVHSIEPGLPATPEDQEGIRTLMGMGLKAKMVPLRRVKEGDGKA